VARAYERVRPFDRWPDVVPGTDDSEARSP